MDFRDGRGVGFDTFYCWEQDVILPVPAGGIFLLFLAWHGGILWVWGCREHSFPSQSTQTLQTGQEGQGTAEKLFVTRVCSAPSEGGFPFSGHFGVNLSHLRGSGAAATTLWPRWSLVCGEMKSRILMALTGNVGWLWRDPPGIKIIP